LSTGGPGREVIEPQSYCMILFESNLARALPHDQRDFFILSDIVAVHHPLLFRIILERELRVALAKSGVVEGAAKAGKRARCWICMVPPPA
jgi:hypothetical protein